MSFTTYPGPLCVVAMLRPDDDVVWSGGGATTLSVSKGVSMAISRNVTYGVGAVVLIALTVAAFAVTSDSSPDKKNAAASSPSSFQATSSASSRSGDATDSPGVSAASSVTPGSSAAGRTPAAGSSSGATAKAGQVGSSATPTAGRVAVTLNKAAFLPQMNGLCATTIRQVQALPVPGNSHDYQAIKDNGDGTLSIVTAFFPLAAQLVEQTTDRDQLMQSWLTPMKADFELRQPLRKKLIDAAISQDDATLQKTGTELDSLPTHSQDILKYLMSYGLTDCVSLVGY